MVGVVYCIPVIHHFSKEEPQAAIYCGDVPMMQVPIWSKGVFVWVDLTEELFYKLWSRENERVQSG